MYLEFSRQTLKKSSNIKFHENPVGAEMFHADGRAYIHCEARCAIFPSLLLLPFWYKCRPQHFILEVTRSVCFRLV